MARILDVQLAERARAQASTRTAPALEYDDDDAAGIPFIEVGAPVSQGQLKPKADNGPTILPLPRPMIVEAKAAELTSYLRVAFHPLPFAHESGQPVEKRISRDVVAFHHPEHAISEQYRRLLTELEKQLEPGVHRSMLFTSGHSGSGTTSVLLNLAATYARRDAGKVLIVDANFSRPSAAERLGAHNAPGLRDVLARTVPLQWTVQSTGYSNLNVIAPGQSDAEFTMDLWPIVLDQLSHRYDWILIDAAEWGRPELAALSGTAQSIFLVVNQDEIDAPELSNLVVDIPRNGGKLRGYVLTSK